MIRIRAFLRVADATMLMMQPAYAYFLAFALAASSPARGLASGTAQAATSPSSVEASRSPVVGARVGVLEHKGPPPMFMPTAVAVARDGRVYVADGVNDRIVWFDAGGSFAGQITKAAGRELANPTGICIDSRDRLWIADTGNARVVGIGLGGQSEKVLFAAKPTSQPGSSAVAPDLTDAVITADGRAAWLIDNDGSRLIRVDVASGSTKSFGTQGSQPGRLDHPFMAAAGADGSVFVTDVINGRIDVFSAAGQAVRSIGTYGVQVGDLYRPSGIAIDRDGRVWVSESVLGVVEVFSKTGDFIGVLRQANGEPLRFDIPMGLAFGPQGRLYVVELHANQVNRVKVAVNTGVAPETVQVRPSGAPAVEQPRVCTACHMGWLYPLSEGRGTGLAKAFAATPEMPHVARASTCLSCHDSVAADSRRAVWFEKSHKTGVKPSEAMQVPLDLPLPDGEMACRTCHVAHGRAGPTTPATAVYVRSQDGPAELCEQCHKGQTGGPGAGMHPLGKMAVDVPQKLRHPGDESVSKKVTCLVCHRAHGATEATLLAVSTTNNTLCLACHQELSAELFGAKSRTQHAREPKLNSDQQRVAQSWQTPVGSQGRLLCMTCHLAHDAKSQQYLLAFSIGQGACAACHGPQATVVGSSHDLRTNHPESKNIIGMTARQGGACSSCHTAHQFARKPSPAKLDPTGQCMTCHRPDHVAAKAALGKVNHPQVTCQKCHNPHEVRFGEFLRDKPSDLCNQCHADMAGVRSGPHDVHRAPQAWPAAAAATQDVCLACHRLHGTEKTGLFRMGLASSAPRPDAACAACHAAAVPKAAGDKSLVHPDSVTTMPAATSLPVSTAPTGKVFIACRSCHDPHESAAKGGAAAVLLRPGTKPSADGLCLTCHPQMETVFSIGHAPHLLEAAGLNGVACQPCHVVHGNPNKVDLRFLWNDKLLAQAISSPLNLGADRYCVCCHRRNGPVAPPRVATHPPMPMFNLAKPGQRGYLPLFNRFGQVAADGTISCRTCHVTHGRKEPAVVLEDITKMSSRELRARQWHLRTFSGNSVCVECHGSTALYRFLYFHDPQRRGTPFKRGVVPAAP